MGVLSGGSDQLSGEQARQCDGLITPRSGPRDGCVLVMAATLRVGSGGGRETCRRAVPPTPRTISHSSDARSCAVPVTARRHLPELDLCRVGCPPFRPAKTGRRCRRGGTGREAHCASSGEAGHHRCRRCRHDRNLVRMRARLTGDHHNTVPRERRHRGHHHRSRNELDDQTARTSSSSPRARASLAALSAPWSTGVPPTCPFS